jgi:hypothetical protein
MPVVCRTYAGRMKAVWESHERRTGITKRHTYHAITNQYGRSIRTYEYGCTYIHRALAFLSRCLHEILPTVGKRLKVGIVLPVYVTVIQMEQYLYWSVLLRTGSSWGKNVCTYSSNSILGCVKQLRHYALAANERITLRISQNCPSCSCVYSTKALSATGMIRLPLVFHPDPSMRRRSHHQSCCPVGDA